ncbi:MAG: hypothetical protein Q9170_005776 [Blastenia crenularia]
MDPLSLTAGVNAGAGLAAKTGIAFNDLRTACKTLPGSLHALSNEVVDIELVLRQVALLVDKREEDPIFKDQQANIPHFLKQARTKLDELFILIQVDLKAISMANNQSNQDQTALQDQLQISFLDQSNGLKAQIDQRLDGVEKLLKTQATQLENHKYKQLGPFYSRQASYVKQRRQLARERSEEKNAGSVAYKSFNIRPVGQDVCVPVIYNERLPRQASLAGLLDKCLSITAAYHYSVLLVIQQHVRKRKVRRYRSQLGPQVGLSSHSRVPGSAQCVNFALNGNVDGLKELFIRGQASPRDVSSTRGYSVLRWAMYGRQYQICKFLVNFGADPDYRPIAVSDNSFRNKAHQALLMGDLSREDEEALMCLTQGSDFVSEHNYTQVSATDIMGRTALAWAACRGDDRAIVILLRFSAKANTLDVQNSAPVFHAADRNHASCVRLLLEAGADPDIAAALGHRVGGPLNCAARNAVDPLVLKSLLDFDADPDASGVDGMTAHIHASRRIWRALLSYY